MLRKISKKKPPTEAGRPLRVSRAHEMKSLVINWNTKFPVDYWWRKQYNVPFGSEQHRSMTFLDMAFEYLEYVEFRIIEIQQKLEFKRQADIKNNIFSQVVPGAEAAHMTKKEIDEAYENLDLSQFDEKK